MNVPIANKRLLTAIGIISVLLGASSCGDSTDELLEEASQAEQSRDYRVASDQLKEAVEDDPESIEARIRLGHVSMAIGDFETAEWALRKALLLGADERTVHVPYIQTLFARAKHKLVIEEADLSIALQPDDRVALLITMGDAYRGLRSRSEAEARYREALKVNPGSVVANVKLARLKFRADEFEAGDEFVARALELDGRYGPALVLRGVREVMQQRYDEAEATFQEVGEHLVLKTPISPDTLETLNDFAVARQTLASALFDAPDQQSAQRLLAAIDSIQGGLWAASQNEAPAVVAAEPPPPPAEPQVVAQQPSRSEVAVVAVIPREMPPTVEQIAPQPVQSEPRQPVVTPAVADRAEPAEMQRLVSPKDSPLAEVEAMQLPAWVERDSVRSALQPGASLERGDIVITGDSSRVVLRLYDGRRTALGSRSQLDVARLLLDPPESVRWLDAAAGSGETGLQPATGVLHDEGRWQLHLVAFSELEHAEELADRLRHAGIPAQLRRAKVSGNIWHRVEVRGFITSEGALSAGNDVQERFNLPAPWVSRIASNADSHQDS